MNKELKIGVFVVVVLTASFFLINYLRGEDIFDKEVQFISRYDDVEGLVPSAPVFIKGFKAGKVTDVTYDSEKGDFAVTCSVSRDFKVPEDSRMVIFSVDIMGGKGVRIDFGTSVLAAADGAFLAPSFEAGLMDGLSDGVGPLLSKASSTLDSLSVTLASVNRILGEDNSQSVSRTLSHLENTMAAVSRISQAVDGKSEEIEDFIDELSSLSVRLGSVAISIDSTMTDVSSIVSEINKADLKGTVDSFKEILDKVNDPDGTLGRLLTDDSVYESVDSLLSDVDELVRKIQDNPKKYIRISVF